MLNKKIFSLLGLLLVLMASFCACMTKKKLAKLKNEYQIFNKGLDSLGNVKGWKERPISYGDKLLISVRSETLNSDQTVLFGNGNAVQYSVTDQGYIALPLLGKISVIGYNRIELTNLLTQQFGKVIKDPFVSIAPLDVQVKVLNQAGNQTIIALPENEANIVNAILKVGGINDVSRKDTVFVIRESDSIRQIFSVDFRNAKAVFESSVYRLQQNDIILIQPNKYYYKQLKNNRTNTDLYMLGSVSIFFGLITLLIPLINNLR
jgi:protein involved in polysaccharide export with SLBB domain